MRMKCQEPAEIFRNCQRYIDLFIKCKLTSVAEMMETGWKAFFAVMG